MERFLVYLRKDVALFRVSSGGVYFCHQQEQHPHTQRPSTFLYLYLVTMANDQVSSSFTHCNLAPCNSNISPNVTVLQKI